jgi:large subunit ribosomal protein L21
MYAIVNIAGQQFKVKENASVYVHRLAANEGDQVEFNQVLLVDNNGSIRVGQPVISGASVTGKVLSHVKGDKVIVFKKKRRKGYQKLNGHRQSLTKVQIEKISA